MENPKLKTIYLMPYGKKGYIVKSKLKSKL